MTENLSFQYCQKLVVLSKDHDAVLLARRKGEADYDGIYSLIGGKMETTDVSLLAGMKREKDEEIGVDATIRVLPQESFNILFRKADGNSMVLPHIAAEFVEGDIALNEEYSDYQWVPIGSIDEFEPKIDTIPEVVVWSLERLSVAQEADFRTI